VAGEGEMGVGGKGGATMMGHPFKWARRSGAGGRTVHGRRRAAMRSEEGRGGQCGGRVARCARQRRSQVVHDRCQNRGGRGLQVGPWHSNGRRDLNSKKKKSNLI
jgi:hypothetical protein